MGVCTTVKDFAEAVARVKGPLSTRHHLLVELLRLMPVYATRRDLGAWEQDANTIPGHEDGSETEKLLWEIFEFGRFNLDTGFDVGGTARELTRLVELLHRHGVVVTPPEPITGW